MGSTAANRIRSFREKKGWSQHQLAQGLQCSQQHVSQIERGEIDPGAHLSLDLAKLATSPEFADDRDYFLRRAKSYLPSIMQLVEELQQERGSAPKPGEVYRIPIVERTAKGNQDTGRLFPMPAHLLPHPASTIAMLVHERVANRTIPAGDIIVVDTSGTDRSGNKWLNQEAAPFLDKIVLVDVDWEHERVGGHPAAPHDRARHSYTFLRHIAKDEPFPMGLFMGHLRCKKLPMREFQQNLSHWVLTLSWASHFEGEEAAQHELHLGDWWRPYDETVTTPESAREFNARMREEAHKQIMFEPHCAPMGVVIAWFPSPRRTAEGETVGEK